MNLFNLHEPPDSTVPIVANLPHSGLFVPNEIAAQFLPDHLRTLPNTDWHLDKLYDFLPRLGVTVLQATHNRYVVDLNRAPKEPFGDFWTAVVPQQTAFKQPIYQSYPSDEQIRSRLQTYYQPYHQKLETLLQAKIAQFGKVYLLDLHSFGGLLSEEICLGERNGQTCSEFLISTIEKQLAHHYRLVRNKVFTGGYITNHYGRMPQIEALQIEVRYPVYLQANQLDQPQIPDWDVSEFAAAKSKFEAVFGAIVQTLSGG